MNKTFSFLYMSIFAFSVFLQAEKVHGSHRKNSHISQTTAETRAVSSAELATNTSVTLNTLGFKDSGISKFIAFAPYSSQVSQALLEFIKTNEKFFLVFMGKMENDIRYRDAMIGKVSEDKELVDLILSKYSQKFLRVALALKMKSPL